MENPIPPCLATHICKCCKKEKNIMLEFTPQRGTKLGFNENCKNCLNERSKSRDRKLYGIDTKNKWGRFCPMFNYNKTDPRDKCLEIN
jgi:hypothetical protein